GSAGTGLSAQQARPLLRPVPRHGLQGQALQLPETSGRRGEAACSRGEEADEQKRIERELAEAQEDTILK
ncbi:hypothetical protein CapIbe_007605, partial [Capra ibex]